MSTGYRRRFRHDDWANQSVLDALADHPPQPPITVRWMAHVLATRWLWLERLSGHAQSHPVWPEWSLADCQTHQIALSAAWANHLAKLDAASLLLEVRYLDSRNRSHTNTVGDVLDHVLLHGSYHRGQIASALRHAGIEPPMTDFIHAIRSGLVE